MKTLHEINPTPTLLQYMHFRHPDFIWEIEGDRFAYRWADGRSPEIYRDMDVRVEQRRYQDWIRDGAIPDRAWAY